MKTLSVEKMVMVEGGGVPSVCEYIMGKIFNPGPYSTQEQWIDLYFKAGCHLNDWKPVQS